jgi:hypothetical protein
VIPRAARGPAALILAVWILCLLPARACGQTVTARGRHLAAVLDSLGVEQRWLPEEPVDWRTGAYDPAGVTLRSHCSAFAAAVCARFGIYLLRPPKHPERFLANAQCAWLEGAGRAYGWSGVGDGPAAQRLANRGEIVLACYRNPERDEAGHIAVIRPSLKTRAALREEGPDLIQAGLVNYRRTSVRNGFRAHPRAWELGKIRYYAHAAP